MSQTLREYQQGAVQSVLAAYEDGYRRVLYTLPTGTGKTTCFAELTRHFLMNEWKVLVLAHRRELINQAYKRIKDHCNLTEWEIGTEIAENSAPITAQVIVGSVMTVKGAHRLSHFQPDVIIVDECHRAAGNSFRNIAKRFGVFEGDCFYIGCTATAKRTDRQSLYAIRADGSRIELLDKKKKTRYLADESECVFQKLVYEYPVVDAIEDGWLVPIIGHTVQTATDLTDVGTGIDGDFQEGALEKAVLNAERTNLAINAWREVCEDRQTLVFCAGVEHAHHAAQLWQDAGYAAEAVDGETPEAQREAALIKFQTGKLQLLMNCGVYTEGTDLPNCSCVVHLRPTKSWNLYVQMTGRGTRTLPGVVDGWNAAEERKRAIQSSLKPNCTVIDLVDITKNQDLCAAPSLLDLPATLNLQGQSVTAAKRLLEDFEEARERVIGECPTTYRELEVRLAQVELLNNSRAKTAQDWAVCEGGFRFRRARPGYQVELLSTAPGEYTLRVHKGGETILQKASRPGEFPLRSYLDMAAARASESVERHVEANLPSRGTLTRLSPKQGNVLRARGHSNEQIDQMPYAKAKALIDKYMQEWAAKQNQTAA